MAYTAHGYWIGPVPRTADDPPPESLLIECRGPGTCPDCTREAEQANQNTDDASGK